MSPPQTLELPQPPGNLVPTLFWATRWVACDADLATDFESEPIARSRQDHSGLDGPSCCLSFS
jgi:hypothetical protein